MTATQEKEKEVEQKPSMVVFTIVWFGQLISLIGSSLTRFGLGVWVFQSTGSVTQFTLITLCSTLPLVVISPIAGSLVDRWPRRWVMILSDSGNGLCTIGITLLLLTGHLQVWHIYIATAINASLNTFQWPAYTAATTLLVPKEQLGRASGMSQIGESASQLISPFLAGVLLVTVGLQSIIIIDLTTFAFAFLTLLFIRFPEVKTTTDKKAGIGSLLAEFASGWNYVATRPGLLGLLFFIAISNLFIGFIIVLFPPLVLSSFSPAIFGTLESLGGIGAVLGSLVMIIWKGPKFGVNTIFLAFIVMALCIIGAGWNSSFWCLAILNFLFLFCWPIMTACERVIWQKKVPSELQGRVFSLQRMVTRSCYPVAASIAGPLDEYVVEPLLSDKGFLAKSIGQFIDVSPGHGINLLFIFSGFFVILVTLAAYQYPRLRLIEDELPDVLFHEHEKGETIPA